MIVEPSQNVPVGKHSGKIVAWTRSQRGGPLYIDLNIAIKHSDGQVTSKTVGYPGDRLVAESRLARLLARFGFSLTTGEEFDLDAALNKIVGSNVVLQVRNESNEKGTFSHIAPDSVTPA